MVVLLILITPVIIFYVARWAWRYQRRLLSLTGAGLAAAAGRPGGVSDVKLTSVLPEESSLLVGFGPAVVPGGQRSPTSAATSGLLLMSLGSDAAENLARLRSWESSGAPLVMWRDSRGEQVELTNQRSGQVVTLSVIVTREPAAPASPVSPRRPL